MFGIKIPHLYFVSKAGTIQLSPQPTVPFCTTEAKALALSQVSPSYTLTNFGSAWDLAVANDIADAQLVGLVNLTVLLPPPTAA